MFGVQSSMFDVQVSAYGGPPWEEDGGPDIWILSLLRQRNAVCFWPVLSSARVALPVGFRPWVAPAPQKPVGGLIYGMSERRRFGEDDSRRGA